VRRSPGDWIAIGGRRGVRAIQPVLGAFEVRLVTQLVREEAAASHRLAHPRVGALGLLQGDLHDLSSTELLRIKLSDPSRASDLREYFRRLDALAVDNEDGTLDLYLLRPAAADDEERALIRAYLEIWARTNGIPAELIG
jgi:hypothetical protein